MQDHVCVCICASTARASLMHQATNNEMTELSSCQRVPRSLVQSGVVDVVISGGGAGRDDDIIMETTFTRTIIRKGPSWLFGTLTLLFNSPRSASVLSSGTTILWSMDRATFLSFVLTHAKGARAVRFLRKLPLLTGLTDDKLVDIASRVIEKVYEAGEFLINAGDRADGLYVIRYARCSPCIVITFVQSVASSDFVHA
jgi:CRP-like cAMP-binding protein